MPSVNLKKAEKMEALAEMTKAKFQTQYNKLMKRRADLSLSVYDDTAGKVGNKLEKMAGKDFQYWLDTDGSIKVCGLLVPKLIIDNQKKSSLSPRDIDFFTRRSDFKVTPERFGQTLSRTVVKPDREFSWSVSADDANAATKKKVATFNKDCKQFCEDIREFYNQALFVLEYVRTSKQVDERFPELWEFLPDGLRERIKQAVVVVDQDAIDAVRDQVKNTKKIR